MNFKTYMKEAIYDKIKPDIEIIFRPLRPHIDEFRKNLERDRDARKAVLEKYFERYRNSSWLYQRIYIDRMSSSELQSDIAREAHENVPISIEVGLAVPNEYNFSEERIMAGISKNVLRQYDIWKENIDKSRHKLYKNEFTEGRVKASIAHELTHWMDDALHDNFLTKRLKKAYAMKLQNSPDWEKVRQGGEDDTYLSDYEVNAVINGIAELKRQNEDVWNELTWEDLKNMYSTLDNLDNRLGLEWRKKIFKRLAREGLLGDRMRT